HVAQSTVTSRPTFHARARMPRSAVAVLLLFASARPALGQTPYRVTWWDAGSVGTAGVLAVLPMALKLPHGLPSCALPCDPASLRENRQSFPSGHASLAFAAATSYLVMAQREQLPHRARNAALMYAGAASVAALRVAGGKHFPTDVIGGAVLGSAIGWLVARIHATVP